VPVRLGAVVDENAACYRHPDRRAAVGCQRCDRPICPECMRPASVGFHCPACASEGSQRVYRARDLRPSRQVTTTLLGLNALLFVAQLSTGGGNINVGLTPEGWLWGPAVAGGEYWRLLTSGFLHASLPHILFNSWALWIFGPVAEQLFDRWRMIGVYLAGLFGGSALVMLFAWTQPTLGASAAVLGLGGAIVGAMTARGMDLRSNNLIGILLLNLLLPLLLPGISFWGHLGGIAGGFVGGYAVVTLGERKADSRSTALVLGGLVVALALVGAWGGRVGGLL
jgi:membrane associated rhomboid family serine protease